MLSITLQTKWNLGLVYLGWPTFSIIEIDSECFLGDFYVRVCIIHIHTYSLFIPQSFWKNTESVYNKIHMYKEFNKTKTENQEYGKEIYENVSNTGT